MRARNTSVRNRAKKATMKLAKGYYGARHRQKRAAMQAVKRAERTAFVSRKLKKREYRCLWITRLNIAAREHGLSYSRFIAGLNKADIRLDRKQLSELAIHEPAAFAAIVEKVKGVLAA